MLKKLIIVIGLAVSGAFLASCFDDNTITYDGPVQMEIKPANATANNIQNGQSVIVSVQLIAPLQNTSHSGSFTFDADGSSGEYGVHFELDGCDFSSSNTCEFTIAPEDSLVKDFEMTFPLDTFPTSTEVNMTFELNDAPSGAGYQVAPNLRNSTVTAIRGSN